MSRMNEMNQALRRQSPRSRWLLELAAPSVAQGRGLPPSVLAAMPRAANANRAGAGLLANLVRATVRTMKQRHTANLLGRLDTRLLNDIGITRGDIDETAAQAAAEAVARKGMTAMPGIATLIKLPAAIVTGLKEARRRQTAIAALQRLSSHTLADIGVERGRIAETVDAMMTRDRTAPASVWATATAKVATAKPVEVAAAGHQLAA